MENKKKSKKNAKKVNIKDEKALYEERMCVVMSAQLSESLCEMFDEEKLSAASVLTIMAATVGNIMKVVAKKENVSVAPLLLMFGYSLNDFLGIGKKANK